MSVSVSGHNVSEITAQAVSHGENDTNWISLIAHLRDGGELQMDLFFRGQFAPEHVRIYAEAIVDANRKIAALKIPDEAFSETVDRVRDAMAAE